MKKRTIIATIATAIVAGISHAEWSAPLVRVANVRNGTGLSMDEITNVVESAAVTNKGAVAQASANAVHYTADTGKTDAQQAQARANIGAADAATVAEQLLVQTNSATGYAIGYKWNAWNVQAPAGVTVNLRLDDPQHILSGFGTPETFEICLNEQNKYARQFRYAQATNGVSFVPQVDVTRITAYYKNYVDPSSTTLTLTYDGKVYDTITSATNATLTAAKADATAKANAALASANAYSANANNLTSGTVAAARIPNLDAGKIASGTLVSERIPNLDADKITSGTVAAARLPLATANAVGAVRPDGTTVTVENGVLTAVGGGGSGASGTGGQLTELHTSGAGRVYTGKWNEWEFQNPIQVQANKKIVVKFNDPYGLYAGTGNSFQIVTNANTNPVFMNVPYSAITNGVDKTLLADVDISKFMVFNSPAIDASSTSFSVEVRGDIEDALLKNTVSVGDNAYLSATSSAFASPMTLRTPLFRHGYTASFYSEVTEMGETEIRLYATYMSGTTEVFMKMGGLKVDATNVSCLRTYGTELWDDYPHGLNVSGSLFVSITPKKEFQVAHLVLESGDQIFEKDIPWCGQGNYFEVKPNSGTYGHARVAYGGSAFARETWICGDSWIDGWLPQMYKYGYDDFAAIGYSGISAVQCYPLLTNALEYAKPKKIVWMIGMNNQDADSKVNANWKLAFDSLRNLCVERGITLVGATICNTTSRTNYYKNAVVRASGIKYLDVAGLFGCEEIGAEGYAGMMGPDHVHATPYGYYVLATYMIQKLQEISR